MGFFRYLRRNVPPMIGLILLAVLIIFTLIGSFFVDIDKDPYPLSSPARLAPTLNYCPVTEPDCAEPKAYPFGTDSQGRNLFAIAVAGTWLTIRIGVLAGIIGVLIGTILGFTSAYYGGAYDNFIRWLVDVLLTIPGLLILVVLASAIGSESVGVNGMALIISALAWMGPTRVIRSQVLSMKERPYVMMARLNGMSNIGIIFRELIPNLLPYLGASLVGSVTGAIFASIGLAALGLGNLRDPALGNTIFWAMNQGAMLNGLWWWIATPVSIIVVIFVMLFMISAGLDELANPRVRRSA
ncbi:MAG: ABC transporter permease [Caldilineaceae bacterium]